MQSHISVWWTIVQILHIKLKKYIYILKHMVSVFFFPSVCFWRNSSHWVSEGRHHTVNILRPTTRMQSFTWVWQHLVCRAVKSHFHPCKTLQTAQGANRVHHPEAVRPIAQWRGRELAALISVCSIPGAASAVWNSRKGKTGVVDPRRLLENRKGISCRLQGSGYFSMWSPSLEKMALLSM